MWACVPTPCKESRPSDSFLLISEEMGNAEWASTGSVASGGVLCEGNGQSGPGVCLGDDQTEAVGEPSLFERGDALLRRMSPYLILPDFFSSSKNAKSFSSGIPTVLKKLITTAISSIPGISGIS